MKNPFVATQLKYDVAIQNKDPLCKNVYDPVKLELSRSFRKKRMLTPGSII